MEDAAVWTVEELVRRAGLALTGSARAGGYAGAPNGRVRELPDQRVLRWYTSIGVVDRPIGGRGRGARYGPRHLRQLVAVKQLQAHGLALAEIQARLAGIGDDELARIAPLPPEVLAPAVVVAAPPAPTVPAPTAAPTLASPPDGAQVPPLPRFDRADSSSRRFWAFEPAAAEHRDPPAAGAAGPTGERIDVRPLAGLELAPGALLVLTAAPHPDDLAEFAEAARPLLAALARRGLIPRSVSPTEPTEGATR